MPQPGSPSNAVPQGEATLMRRIEDIERTARELPGAIMSSIGPAIRDLRDQQATLTTAVANISTLIGAQIAPMYGDASASNYTVPAGYGSNTTRASFTFTVPAGYTKALIQATANDGGVNSTAVVDYLVSKIRLTTPGFTEAAFASSGTTPAGYAAAATMTSSWLRTGLSAGATLTLASQPYSAYGTWATNASNATFITGTCLFMR